MYTTPPAHVTFFFIYSPALRLITIDFPLCRCNPTRPPTLIKCHAFGSNDKVTFDRTLTNLLATALRYPSTSVRHKSSSQSVSQSLCGRKKLVNFPDTLLLLFSRNNHPSTCVCAGVVARRYRQVPTNLHMMEVMNGLRMSELNHRPNAQPFHPLLGYQMSRGYHSFPPPTDTRSTDTLMHEWRKGEQHSLPFNVVVVVAVSWKWYHIMGVVAVGGVAEMNDTWATRSPPDPPTAADRC